jgi:hypothetical protein
MLNDSAVYEFGRTVLNEEMLKAMVELDCKSLKECGSLWTRLQELIFCAIPPLDKYCTSLVRGWSLIREWHVANLPLQFALTKVKTLCNRSFSNYGYAVLDWVLYINNDQRDSRIYLYL